MTLPYLPCLHEYVDIFLPHIDQVRDWQSGYTESVITKQYDKISACSKCGRRLDDTTA